MTATSSGKASMEDSLLKQYGGREKSMPQTIMFDQVSPATRLLEKRRQMFEVQEALNAQKEEFSRREDAFRRREDVLRRKDLELQESLIKFNKFLQENESKRNRANKKASDEKKQKELKEMDIKKLEIQLRTKITEERSLKEELEKNIKYQDYLENVVQNMSKFFPEISDVLNRYKTLRDANKYLLEKQLSEETSQDNLAREFQNYKKSKENQILNFNNEIAELQVKFEQYRLKTSKLQSEIDLVNEAAADKILQLGQILHSVSNILYRCEETFRRRHNKPPADKVENMENLPLSEQVGRTLSKLDDIAMVMVDFKDVKDEFVDETKVAESTAQKKTGGSAATTIALQQTVADTKSDAVTKTHH